MRNYILAIIFAILGGMLMMSGLVCMSIFISFDQKMAFAPFILILGIVLTLVCFIFAFLPRKEKQTIDC